MIVGVTGTIGNFDRLVAALVDYARTHPNEPCWLQHGGSFTGDDVAGAPFVARAELIERMDAADVVVCHAASGTVVDAITLGHVPVVVPRLRQFGEVVDDHQLDLFRALARAGRIVAVEDVRDLSSAIDRARGQRKPRGEPSGRRALVEALRSEIDHAGTPTRRTRRWMLDAFGLATRWVSTATHRWP